MFSIVNNGNCIMSIVQIYKKIGVTMAANVETMFSAREKPWHGIGIIVGECPDSREAIGLAGMDWKVVQKDVFTNNEGVAISGYRVNVRDCDQSILGVVSDRYQVVQNEEVFAFTDELLFDGSVKWLMKNQVEKTGSNEP